MAAAAKKAEPNYPAIAVHVEALLPKNLLELDILTSTIHELRRANGEIPTQDVKMHVGTLNQNVEFTWLV